MFQTFVVEEEAEEKTILEAPNVDIPLASTAASSLFSSRFVMVVSTQLVFAEQNNKTTLDVWQKHHHQQQQPTNNDISLKKIVQLGKQQQKVDGNIKA